MAGVSAGARENEELKESSARPRERPPPPAEGGAAGEEEKRLALNSSGCFFCSAIYPVSNRTPHETPRMRIHVSSHSGAHQ